jgi:DNA end-binding protein Ku
MWKGTLCLGETKLPLKLFAAVEDRDVHFRLLERATGRPVHQRMLKSDSDEIVPADSIEKGYPTEDGAFVLLSKQELAALAPAPSRNIEVLHFVEHGQVTPEWVVRPYHLAPDGAPEAYVALREALSAEGVDAVLRWVMRNVEYTGLLSASGEYLTLVTLRHRGEVLEPSALPKPSGRAHSAKEAQMAEQLVQAFADEFAPETYANEHRERILQLVAQKAQGKRVQLPKAKAKQTAPNLADALQKSLQSLNLAPKPKRRSAHATRRTSRTEHTHA